MGHILSKESNVDSGVIQELSQVFSGSGSGKVMYFEGGYEQTVEETIMWGIKNFVVGADCYEHTLDAEIEGGAMLSFLLRPSPEIPEDVVLSCSSKSRGQFGKSFIKKGSLLSEKRRFSVKATIHGSPRMETYKMPVKMFGESCDVSIKKDLFLSLLADSGSLLLELTVTVFQETPVVRAKENITSAFDASGKTVPSKLTEDSFQELPSKVKIERKGEVEERGQDDMKQIAVSAEDEILIPSSLEKTGRVSLLSRFRQHPKNSMLPTANKLLVEKEVKSISSNDRNICVSCNVFLGSLAHSFAARDLLKGRCPSKGRDRQMTPEELQELIRERKSGMNNEANQRRLGDLKRIADMYSRTGIDPLELFPREIWEKILDRMKPGDRANMRNVHQLFEALLKNTLVGDTLLPLVLDYKIPLVQRYLAPRTWRWYQASPGRPDLTNLMTLRCVSKTLKDSVDKWFEDRLLYTMSDSDENKDAASEPKDYEALNSFDLNLGRDFNEIIEWPKNLFVRSIKVHFASFLPKGNIPGEKQRRYEKRLNAQIAVTNENIAEFWRRVGSQILHAYLDFSGMYFYGTLRFAYDLVRSFLPFMPNLKWLQLRYAVIEDYDLQMEPLTCMGQLERLDFNHFSGSDTDKRLRIRELVLEANPCMKYFQSKGKLVPHTHIDVYTNPVLLSLPLESVELRQERAMHWQLQEHFQQISNNSWNLNRISMWIGDRGGYSFWTPSIDSIFGFIQRFQALEKVVLYLNHVAVGEKLNFLKLPNLKDFMIEFGPEVTSNDGADIFFSLQFLLRCGRLWSLIWEDLRKENAQQPIQHTMEPEPLNDGIVLGFRSGREDLRESIIWDVFPRLGSVKVKFVEVDADDIYSGRSVQREYRERRLISEDECACKWEPPVESSSDSDS